MSVQNGELGSFRKLLVWFKEEARLIFGLLVVVVGVALSIRIVYVATEGKSEATADEIVEFMAENSCHETTVRTLVTHGQPVTESRLETVRELCQSKAKGQEAIRKFDAIQALTEQQPGLER